MTGERVRRRKEIETDAGRRESNIVQLTDTESASANLKTRVLDEDADIVSVDTTEQFEFADEFRDAFVTHIETQTE